MELEHWLARCRTCGKENVVERDPDTGVVVASGKCYHCQIPTLYDLTRPASEAPEAVEAIMVAEIAREETVAAAADAAPPAPTPAPEPTEPPAGAEDPKPGNPFEEYLRRFAPGGGD